MPECSTHSYFLEWEPGGRGGHCAQEVRGPLLFSQNLGTAGRPGAGAGQGVSGAEPSASLMPV